MADRAQRLSDVLRDACTIRGVPGAVVAVLLDGEVVAAAHGVENAERSVPVGLDTHFQVASITKTFTAAAVMLLVEDGLVSLDDSVHRHLPDFGVRTGLDGDAITVEHLLSHQSGFDGDQLFVTGDMRLEALAGARRLFEPGTGFSYSNAGFSVAGEVIEAASGESYERVVRDRLLKPLGLTTAAFTADRLITHPVASPHWVWEGEAHVVRGGGWQPGWELQPLDWAAAGLAATPEQLLRWGRFQWEGTADDGSRLLSDESLARLHTPVVRGEPLEDVGLDWFVREVDGVTAISHGGLSAGYVTNVQVLPERQAVVACATNATNGAGLIHEVRRWLFPELLGLDLSDPVPDPSLDVDPARLAGTYWHPFSLLDVVPDPDQPTRARVTPREHPEPLGWHPPLEGPCTVGFFDEDTVISVDHDPVSPPTLARFGFGLDGQAEWLQWGGRLAPRIA
jgi:CubicO group peptidase (beta-lactamase class C family)